MKALLVGSAALKFWFADARTPKNDFDFFIDHTTLNDWINEHRGNLRHIHYLKDDIIQVELRTGNTLGFDNTKYKSVQKFIDLNSEMPVWDVYGIQFNIASPESLLAIKQSHIHHRHNWHKHIKDYAFLKEKGLELTDTFKEAFALRSKEREARQDFKKPGSLSKANEEFFARSENSVRRKFVHDELHEIIAYHDKPLYTKAKRDQSKALLDKDLFEAFSLEDQLCLVREETYVIGLERIVIPSWYNQYLLQQSRIINSIILEPKIAEQAYSYALMRICTDLTKGWFREFATEHYTELHKPDCDFVDKFVTAFNSQRLKFKAQ